MQRELDLATGDNPQEQIISLNPEVSADFAPLAVTVTRPYKSNDVTRPYKSNEEISRRIAEQIIQHEVAKACGHVACLAEVSLETKPSVVATDYQVYIVAAALNCKAIGCPLDHGSGSAGVREPREPSPLSPSQPDEAEPFQPPK